MLPTAIVYSSHNRCNYINNDWIVQRALRGNKNILYLPMSEGVSDGDEYTRQEYNWSKFSWFFDFYRQYGLHAFPFYWNSNLSENDVDSLFESLSSCEAVILGGGNPWTGYERYTGLGHKFYGDSDAFNKVLHQRQAKGLLTVGYSAGADQLCQYMASTVDENNVIQGFALCRNIMAISHYDHGKENYLMSLATRFKHCMLFGLPNDSALAVNQGFLKSGNIWQVIRLITDCSWDRMEDRHHIKTLHGMLIQHYYPDGRQWAFNGGDVIIRIQSVDGGYNKAFIMFPNGRTIDHWTQKQVEYGSIEQILDNEDI